MAEPKPGKFEEIGTTGLEAYAGFINEAYIKELYWPDVVPLYDKIWRSDPEVSIVRLLWDSWSSHQSYEVILPDPVGGGAEDQPSEDDEKARDFYAEVLDDIEGGFNQWLTSCITRVPFYGWGWWEAPVGIRKAGWKAPGQDDPWRSDYDDGLIGYRRLAFRRYSSFYQWDMDDETGRVRGMMQNDPPKSVVTIPIERSLHVVSGDSDNPEGLAMLEALWRLERYKYNLEIIQGLGFEHAAGHAVFKASKKLDDEDNALIRKAARAVATAQEGNYISLPEHLDFSLKDIGFQAGPSILQALRFYSILKLAILGMQWIAMSTIAGVGSFAAVQDASQMALMAYNSMVEGFIRAFDEQLGRRLFDYPVNKAAFPGMTRRPLIRVKRVEKKLSLTELGAFGQAIASFLPLGQEDWVALRKATGGILPEIIPEDVLEAVEQQKKLGEAGAKPAPGNKPTQEGTETEAEESVGAEGEPEEEAELSMELADNQDGVMVALFLPPSVAMKYAQRMDGALPANELHLTLAYLGKVPEQTNDRRKLLSTVQRFASTIPEIKGRINGYGRFSDTHLAGKEAIWLSLDAPDLPGIRQQLVNRLEAAGFTVPKDHGFTPHITLAYIDPKKKVNLDFEPSEVTFDQLWAAWGNDAYSFGTYGGEDPLGRLFQPEKAEMAFRPFTVTADEFPTDVSPIADDLEEGVPSSMRRFIEWAEQNDPKLAGLLKAKIKENGSG